MGIAWQWMGRASKGGWQMISSPPSSHPFQDCHLSKEQIRSAQLRIQESSGIVLSPQVLQPSFRPMQSSSEGEGETPCGGDQGLEQLADVSGSNVEVHAEKKVKVSGSEGEGENPCGSDQVQSPDKLVSPGCSIVVYSLAPHPRCTPPHNTLTALHLTPHSPHSTSTRFAVSSVSLTTRRTPAAVWKRCRS